MSNIKFTAIRIKNALLYKVGVKFPYSKVRAKSLRALGHEVGNDVYFPAEITITQNFVHNRGHLVLGDRVSIGPNCTFILTSHSNASRIRGHMAQKKAEIVVQDDAWLGACVVVLPGIIIGKGAVVGAGSVVTKNVEPYTVVVGNPARVIRKINVDNGEA